MQDTPVTKDDLHAELDRVVPVGTRARSTIRMVGHALIELGLVTSVECAYEHCVMPTRAFALAGAEGTYRGRGIVTVDHVLPLCDGGTDLPSNLQLMHFACNARKGSLEGFANPESRARHSAAGRDRWKDPEYRAKMTNRKHTPEERAAKSAKMKAKWADPEWREATRAARSDATKRAWDKRRMTEGN